MSIYGKKGTIPSKFQVEILMTKIKEYFNLQKDRKSNDAVKEERVLMKLLNSPGRSKLQQYLAMEKIVNILRYINALRFLIAYTEAIKQNSVTVSEPLKHQSRLYQMLPYAMGIIYAAKPTGLNCIAEFKAMMEEIFGKENLELTYNKGDFIPVELRKCFEPMQPSFKEINQYALEMCQRNEYSFETLNSVGHNFSPYGGNVGPYFAGTQKAPSGQGCSGSNNGNNGGYGAGNNGGYGNQSNQNYAYNYGNNAYDYGANNKVNGNGGGTYDNNNPYTPKVNAMGGYGGSYIPSFTPTPTTKNENPPASSYLPKYQPTDYGKKQQSEFRFPATSSTYFGGPPNPSTFY